MTQPGVILNSKHSSNVLNLILLPQVMQPLRSPTLFRELIADWHWVDAPVLYPRVAEEEKITILQPERIIQWLKEH